MKSGSSLTSSAHNLTADDILQLGVKLDVRFDNANLPQVWQSLLLPSGEFFQDKSDLPITVCCP